MKTAKAILSLFAVIVSLLLLIGLFNYSVDVYCFYNCKTITPEQATLNRYYQVAQKMIAQPNLEYLILGSSRGETTNSEIVEILTKKKESLYISSISIVETWSLTYFLV